MPAVRGAKSKKKTRRFTRGIDEIQADLADGKHLKQYTDTKAVEDLPGLGQWYCVECAKWYESEANFEKHKQGKPHKRRVKQAQEEPYSQKEADAAVGLWTDNGKRQDAAMKEATAVSG